MIANSVILGKDETRVLGGEVSGLGTIGALGGAVGVSLGAAFTRLAQSAASPGCIPLPAFSIGLAEGCYPNPAMAGMEAGNG